MKHRKSVLSAAIVTCLGFAVQVQAQEAAPAAEQAKSWTGMQHHMDMIADALADGIARQFPNKVN